MMRNFKVVAYMMLAGLIGLPAVAYSGPPQPGTAPAEAAQPGTVPAKAARPRTAPAEAARPAPAPASRAVLTVKEPVYNFGTVMEGEPLEHVFEVRNTGKDPLIIDRVRPG